jgi:hypothetical protein
MEGADLSRPLHGSTPTTSDEFANELEIFRREAESSIQFFCAWRTINTFAAVATQGVRA